MPALDLAILGVKLMIEYYAIVNLAVVELVSMLILYLLAFSAKFSEWPVADQISALLSLFANPSCQSLILITESRLLFCRSIILLVIYP